MSDFEDKYPNLAAARDASVRGAFAKGGPISPDEVRLHEVGYDKEYLKPKKKHRIVMEKGEWVMNKKTIQDRINEKYNGR